MTSTLDLLSQISRYDSGSFEHLNRRYLGDGGTQALASDAAALALENNKIELAVSCLEQGQLIAVSRGFRRNDSGVNDGRGAGFAPLSPNRTVLSLSTLQEAATCGPVIIVNIDARRSYAIIVHASGSPILVPLRFDRGSYREVVALARALEPSKQALSTRLLINILREIWHRIVFPVVEELDKHALGDRIWWYPIGAATLLPLHAAGPYEEAQKNLSDRFVSSYIPTLEALIRARRPEPGRQPIDHPFLSAFVVSPKSPHPPSTPPLVTRNTAWIVNPAPATPRPIGPREKTATQAPNSGVRIIQYSKATSEAVLSRIEEYNLLHLICHCRRDREAPFQPLFLMYNGHFSPIDVARRQPTRAELAILSLSRPSDDREPFLLKDSLHPAAGMMLAGFKSVVASVEKAQSDKPGKSLMERFCDGMQGESYDKAAVILKKVRFDDKVLHRDRFDDKKILHIDRFHGDATSLMQYVNTVHYGV